MPAWSRGILLVAFAAPLLGCGGGDDLNRFKEGLVPVSGKIMLDGEPLQDAGVLFIPSSSATSGKHAEVGTRMAMGETDTRGVYSLISPPHGADARPQEYLGCVPGVYVVILDRKRLPDGSVPDPAADDPQVMKSVQTIPAKFTNPRTSEMKATVTATGGEIDFDLKSK